jgi:hypothetical protein
VVCTGRFYFFIEKRNGRWGLVLFKPIFEKDRLDPVDPSATLKLDKELLSRYPCHLGSNSSRPSCDMVNVEIEALWLIRTMLQQANLQGFAPIR